MRTLELRPDLLERLTDTERVAVERLAALQAEQDQAAALAARRPHFECRTVLTAEEQRRRAASQYERKALPSGFSRPRP